MRRQGEREENHHWPMGKEEEEKEEDQPREPVEGEDSES